jgi:hypothetical protein
MFKQRAGQQWVRDSAVPAHGGICHVSTDSKARAERSPQQPGLAPPIAAASPKLWLITPPHHSASFASLIIPIWLHNWAQSPHTDTIHPEGNVLLPMGRPQVPLYSQFLLPAPECQLLMGHPQDPPSESDTVPRLSRKCKRRRIPQAH